MSMRLLLAAAIAFTPFDGVTSIAPVSEGLPVKAPAAVGMSAERLAAIDRVVAHGVEAGGFPGAAVVVGRRGYTVFKRGYGHLGWTNDSPRVTPDRSIYDLASLSKVIGTTTAVMVLYDEGRIQLDAPVRTYLPEFSGGLKDQVTVRQLLTHRSGLPAGRELWREARSPQEAREIVLRTPLGCRPGACYEYSDLGADVLGWVVEAAAHESLDRFLEERVFAPLGMTDTEYRPADSLRYRTAPTEVTPPRGYPLRGEVHDENAYALGGVAGHAGLFSTAADLSIFAQMMLNGGEFDGVRIIADSTVELFTRRAAGTRALGWDTAEGGVGSGDVMSPRSYGHTGYTGTSIWIDPDRQLFVILLTNRVHAARARRPAKVISDVRNDLADAAALAVTDLPDGALAMPASFRADRAQDWNRPVRSARSRRHATSRKTVKKAVKKSSSKASASKSAGSARSSKAKASASRAAKARPAKHSSRTVSASKAKSASASSAKKSSSKKSSAAKKPR